MKLVNGIIRTTTNEGFKSKLYVTSRLKQDTGLENDVLLLKRLFFTKFPQELIVLKEMNNVCLCEENVALQEPTLLTLISALYDS
jgi:hypothetical protein